MTPPFKFLIFSFLGVIKVEMVVNAMIMILKPRVLKPILFFRISFKDGTENRALFRYYTTFPPFFPPSKKKSNRIKRERAVMATKKCTEFRFISFKKLRKEVGFSLPLRRLKVLKYG